MTEAPQSVYACHCRDCQRLTSSAFSMGVVVPETAFKLGGVEPRALQRLADSGRTSTRWVCPDCGSWIAGLILGVVLSRPGWMERYVPAELRDAARSTLTAFGFSCAGLMFVLVAMNPLLVVAVDPMTWAPFHLFVRPTSMVVLFLIEHAHLRLARARPHLDLADGAVVEGGSDRGN
jgi:hypothetical protein